MLRDARLLLCRRHCDAVDGALEDMRDRVIVPDAGRVWCLTQIRARRENAEAAGRPIRRRNSSRSFARSACWVPVRRDVDALSVGAWVDYVECVRLPCESGSSVGNGLR